MYRLFGAQREGVSIDLDLNSYTQKDLCYLALSLAVTTHETGTRILRFNKQSLEGLKTLGSWLNSNFQPKDYKLTVEIEVEDMLGGETKGILIHVLKGTRGGFIELVIDFKENPITMILREREGVKLGDILKSI